jgi:hypothetical protein
VVRGGDRRPGSFAVASNTTLICKRGVEGQELSFL